MKYRPDIDGLRAVAVIPVVLFHLKLEAFSGGFVGVDVFFVISGYLITSLIVEEIKDGRFSLISFYERRARRILPALFAVILASSVAASLLFPPARFVEFGDKVAATALFVSNFSFLNEGSYFGTPEELKPLLHTWSLAVEEQFYIVFPIALILVARFAGRRWVMFVVSVGVLSFTASVWSVETDPRAAFFSTPSRTWELMLGAVLALRVIPPITNRALIEIAGITGVIFIGLGVFIFSAATPFPGAYALLPCLGAVLVIHSSGGTTNRLLSIRPLVFVGLISYSLYLWHWPLIVFARHYLLRDPAGFEVGIIILMSGLVAALSWRFIERPFRGSFGLFPSPVLFVTAGAAMVLFITAGMVAPSTPGWRPATVARPDIEILNAIDWDAGCHITSQDIHAVWQSQKCIISTGHSQNALLWGDSFAAHYASGFIENSNMLSQNLYQYTFGGCAPAINYDPALFPGCHPFNERAKDILKRLDIKTVILSARWQTAFDMGLKLTDIGDTVSHLHEMGIDVIVIGQSPVFPIDVRLMARKPGSGDHAPNVIDKSLNEAIRRSVVGATFIDATPILCQGDDCKYREGGEFYFADYGHFSDVGSARVIKQFLSTLGGAI